MSNKDTNTQQDRQDQGGKSESQSSKSSNAGGGNPPGGNPGEGSGGAGHPGGGNPGNPGGGGSGGGDKKITLHVLIEGGRSFTDEYVVKQKLQVIVNKTVAHFSLADAEKRELRRNEGTLLSDYSLTIEEAELRDNETLKFLLKKAPQPEGPKKFA